MSQHDLDNKDLAHDHHETLDKADVVAAGQVHTLTLEERANAFEEVRRRDPGPGWFSHRGIQFMMIALTAMVCSGEGGFDGTIYSSINSMEPFLNYFELFTSANEKTGLVFGMGTLGSVAGFFPAYYLPDRIGRRWPMFIGNAVLIGGALLNGFATNFGQLLGSRFLVGFGAMIAGNSAKPWLAEMSSPHNRGRIIGIYNTFWYVGNILATGVTVPFGYMNTNWSWRVPVLLQIVPSAINMAFVMFLPESPRWLYAQGRKQEATRILAKYHSQNNDEASPMVMFEVQEMETHISQTGLEKKPFDFSGLFNSRANLYRYWMATIVAVWGQLSGNAMVSYFLPVLLQQAGIESSNRQRVLNLASAIVSFGCATIGSLLADHAGRRKLLLFGETSAMVTLAIVAGLVSPSGSVSRVRSNAGITFIFLFSALFSAGWTPMQGIYPAEVFSYENRTKGLTMVALMQCVASCVNSFGIPPALEALTWRTYLIFMAFDAVGVVCIYIWAVETKQLSLEDLDDVFDSNNPKRTSLAIVKARKRRGQQEPVA